MSGRPTRDVVVVGGGPAGSATAIRLARAGFSVVVLDRSHFPRSKPCGECLSPGAIEQLEQLEVLPRVLALPHGPLEGWTIGAPSGSAFSGSFPATRTGIAVQRRLLDALLLDEARRSGAEVRCGVRVAAPVVEGGAVVGVRLSRSAGDEVVKARLVVGADGLRSVIARRLRLVRRPPRLRKLALTAHLRVDDGVRRRGELHLLENGCIGVAGVCEGVANVTVVVSGAGVGEVAGSREEYFDHTLASHAFAEGWSRIDDVLATGPFDWPVSAAAVNGAVLVGDAAGYYDPFTGQGIYRALRGAAAASAAAENALRRSGEGAGILASDDRERRREFGPGERLQRAIEAVVSRSSLMELATRGLRAAPRLADALVAVVADIAPARSLLHPRLLREKV